MKNFNLNEVEKWLKRSLKNKVSINDRTIVTFLITGAFFALGATALHAHISISDTNGTSIVEGPGNGGRVDNVYIGRNITGTSGDSIGNVIIGTNAKTSSSTQNATIVGRLAKGTANNVISIGTGANATGAMGIAIGSAVSPDTIDGSDTDATRNGPNATAERAIAIGDANTASGTRSISIGSGAQATTSGAIAIGKGAKSRGTRTIVIGQDVDTTKSETIAIGTSIDAAKLESSVFIGHRITTTSQGNNNQGIAIGKSIITTDQAIAIGGDMEASGRSSIALGGDDTNLYTSAINYNKNNINYTTDRYAKTKALGDSAIAIGTGSVGYSSASTALGVRAKSFGAYSTALGPNSQAETEGSIALGRDSVADRAAGVNGLMLGPSGASTSSATDKIWRSTLGAVSVGNSTNTRQITGVAAGSEDTDAVNVAQLKGVSFKYYSVNSTVDGTDSNKTNNKATGANAMAIGPNANSSGASSIVIGTTDSAGTKKSYTNDENSVVIGVGSSVQNGANGGNSSVAIGRDSYTKNSFSSVVMGHGSSIISARESVAIGKGISVANRNSTALGSDVSVVGDFSVGLGNNIKFNYNQTNVKHGNIAVGSSINVNSSSESAVALGKNITVNGDRAVALGTDTQATAAGAIAIGRGTNVSGNSSIGIGAYLDTNNKTEVSGGWSVGIGNNARVTANDAVAIGGNAKVTQGGGIALGSDSEASTGVGTTGGYDILKNANSTTTGLTWVANKAALSIGKAGASSRRIVNLAAGIDDTDAVNVAQLKQVKLNYRTTSDGTNTKTATIAQGLSFLSPDNTITIEALDNGKINFSLASSPTDNKTITFTGNNTGTSFVRANNTNKTLQIQSGSFTNSVGTATTAFDGKNIATFLDPTGVNGDTATLKIGIKNDPEFTKVTLTQDAANDNEAVRFGQLKTYVDNVKNNITNSKITFKDGSAGAGAQVGLGDTVIHKDTGNSKNLTVELSTTGTPTYTYKIKDNPEFEGKVKATNGFDANNKKIVNVAAGTANTDAVNYGQLKEVEDKIAGNLANIKAISLKSPAVYTYTDPATNQDKIIVKANDNKYYDPNDIDDQGAPRQGANAIDVQPDKVHVSIVNNSGTGSVNTPVNLRNIADGKISNDSTDAINGSQLFDLANKMGLVDNTGAPVTPTYTAPTNPDGTQGTAPTNVADAINQLASAVNKGIKFDGDTQAANSSNKTQFLGSKLEIKAGDVGNDHKGKNLLTEYKYDGGNGILSIGLKDNPEFTEIDLKGTNGKDGKIGVDADGNVVVTNGIDGQNGGTPTRVVTEDSVGNMTLTYKANSNETGKKTTTLSNGLDFLAEGENLSVAIGNDGKVTYTLNVADSAVTNDTANPANNTNKLVTENAVRNYVTNQLNAEKTRYVSIKPTENDKTQAGSNFNNDGAIGASSIAIGRYAKTQGDYGVALGTGANAKELDTIALGSYAASEGKASISVGQSANSTADNSVSLGNFSKATAEGAVALGVGSLADRNRNEFGKRYDTVTNADDYLTEVNKKADYDNLTTEITTKNDELRAIQTEIATLENANQDATAKYAEADAKIEEIKTLTSRQNKLISAWKSTLGAVSVGNSETGDTRQITGVAAGTQDTDAVNVAQLNHLADREFTFTDGEADNNFVRKNSDNDKKITIKAGDSATGYKGDNLKVKLDKDTGEFLIGLKESPEFKSLALKDGTNVVNFTPSAANTLKLTGTNPTDTVKLTNLTNGDVSETSKDAINGSQLFDLRKELGLEEDPNAVVPNVGPAGKDGLNGKSVVEKVDALRDGTAGNQVYTKPDGTRVIKEVQPDGTVKYYAVDPATNAKKDPAEEVPASDLVISAVNPDGTTTTPTAMGNVASGLGLNGQDGQNGAFPKPITPEKAKDVVGGLLTNNNDNDLNKVATVRDLQAIAQSGLYFKGNVANGTTDATTHRALTETLEIIGKEGVNSFADYTTDNVATKVSEGKIEIGILKKPKFEELKLQEEGADKPTISLTPENGGLKLSKDPADATTQPADDKVVLSGLKDGNTPDSAVTKGALDKIIKDSLGEATDDAKDPRNGVNGADGQPLAQNAPKGAAGNDNLNGQNVNNKINALRRGEAGIVVYTDENGNRVAKAKDGKFYDKSNVSPAGDLVSENYVKIGENYYNKADIDENGKLKDPNATPVDKATAEAEFANITAKDDANIRHSLVNSDGSTTKPSILGNVASALGLDNTKAATFDTSYPKIKELLTLENGLDKVVTLRDLQAAAITGLTFTGDDDTADKIHRSLSQTLKITGSKDNLPTEVAEGNITVKKDGDDTLRIKLAKDVNNVDTIAGGDTKAKITLTEADKITVGAGATNTPVNIEGVAKGEISDNSTQAINGAQLKDLLTQLGLIVDGNNTDLKSFSIATKLSPVNNTDTAPNNPNNLVSMVEEIMKRMNKGYLVGGDQTQGTDDLVHTLGAKINVKAAENTLTGKAEGDKKDKTFVGKNLLTEYNYSNGNADISIGLSENPEFKSLTLKDGNNEVNFKPSAENTLKLSGATENDKIKVTNLADGDIVENSTDAVTGGQIFDLRKELGLEPKDTEKFDPDRKDSAGKDGLAGKSFGDKINALRDGTAGNQVYTKPDGTRVVRGDDGKYYAVDPATGKKKEPAEEVPASDLVISSVNPTGDGPIGMANVKSGLGLDGKNADGTDGSPANPKTISPEKAKTAVNDLLTKEGTGLNNVATVGDLQAIAQSGLTFKANSGDDVHRPLSSTLSIVGNKTEFEKIAAMPEDERAAKISEYVAKFNDKNVITTTDTTNNEISIRFAERPEFKGIDVVDPAKPDDKVAIDTIGTTVTGKDGGKFVKTVTGKDGITITKSDKEDGTNNNGEPTKETAKYGLDGATIQKDNDRVEITPDEIKVTNTNPDDDSDRSSTSIKKNKIAMEKADGTETFAINGADGTNATTIVVKDKDGANGVTIDGSGKITGLENRNPTDNDDYGVNNNKNRAATEGALRDITDKLGLTPDVSNNNPPEKTPDNQPGGNDGLDGKTFKDKINALRNGQAGPMVYTKPDGTRLVRDENGNLYPAKADGTPDTNAEIVKPEDAILSAVGPDGKISNKPTTLSNIKSAFDGNDKANEKFVEAAKNLTYELPYYNFEDDRTDEEKAADNNRAVNKGDLINMALLGLNFEGNEGAGEEIHRPLSTKVLIQGEGTNGITNEDFKSASGNIQVVSKKDTSTLTVRLAENLKNMESFETKDFSENQDDENAIKSKSKLDKDGLAVDTKDGASTKVNAGNIEIKGADKEEPIKIDGNTGVITGVEVGDSPTSAVNRGYVDEKIGKLEDTVSDLKKSTSKGIAGAMAQAGVKFQEIGVNQAVVGAAVSNYKGQHGVAVGIQGAPTENIRVHGIISATPGNGKGSNPGVTVGASWKFNLK